MYCFKQQFESLYVEARSARSALLMAAVARPKERGEAHEITIGDTAGIRDCGFAAFGGPRTKGQGKTKTGRSEKTGAATEGPCGQESGACSFNEAGKAG